MKKTFKVLLFVSSFFLMSSNASAQFWEKLDKALTKTEKALDAVSADTNSESNSNGKTSSSEDLVFETPHSSLSMKIIDHDRSGDKYIINCLITNTDDDIDSYRFNTFVCYDDLGNEYRPWVQFGSSRTTSATIVGSALLKDTPVKVILTLNKVPSKVTTIKQIRLGASAYFHSTKAVNGNFIYKDLTLNK